MATVEYLRPGEDTPEGGLQLPAPIKVDIPLSFKPPDPRGPIPLQYNNCYCTRSPRFEELGDWEIGEEGIVIGSEGHKEIALPDFGVTRNVGCRIGISDTNSPIYDGMTTVDLFIGIRDYKRSKGPIRFYLGGKRYIGYPPGDGIWRWPIRDDWAALATFGLALDQRTPTNCLQPKFERVPVTTRENFPAVADFEDGIGWRYVADVAKKAFRKDADGRIYVHWDSGVDESGIFWQNINAGGYSQGNYWEIVVDYLIPGGSIRVEQEDGTLELEITKAGRYSGTTISRLPRIMTGQKPAQFGANFKGDGWGTEHVISYFNTGPFDSFPWNSPYKYNVNFFWACDGRFTDVILAHNAAEASRVGQSVRTPGGLVTLPGQQILYGQTPPIVGYFSVGDLCYNVSGSGDNWAWRCIDAGNPGEWALVPVPPPPPAP
jgi:hypothetical protein